MKHFSKRLAACGLALFLSVSVLSGPDTLLTVSAHPGRTDSRGGHHDYKNKSGLGSYHYHHGYPAHLHEGGVCPYDTPQPDICEPDVPDTSLPAVETPMAPLPETSAAEDGSGLPAVDYSFVFDAGFYAAANPDVAAVCGTDAGLLLQHFLTSGMQEGRQGCAAFNVLEYRMQNPDLIPILGDDLPAYYHHYCNTCSSHHN